MTDYREWRLLTYENMNPYEATTLEDALHHEVSEDRSPSTVFICTMQPCVSFADKIDMSSINIEECRRRGFPIIKYIVGHGGPLFSDPSNLILLIFQSLKNEAYLSSRKALDLLTEVFKGTFAEFGLELKRSEYRPLSNDLLVNTRKVSSMFVGKSKGCMVYLAGILVDFNYDLAEKVLNIHPSKFTDKPHKTIREWVTTLKRELGRNVSIEELRESLIQQIKEKFDVVLFGGELTREEKELAIILREKHESKDWLKRGKWSPVKDYWRPK